MRVLFTLPRWVVEPLARFLIRRFDKLPPHPLGDIHSVKDGSLYMLRRRLFDPSWWNGGVSARVHNTKRSDSDRHLHDHPWWTISVILRNPYIECTPSHEQGVWYEDDDGVSREVVRFTHHKVGAVVFRRATDRHRLIVPHWHAEGCWSLFIMGPKVQTWGFHTPGGKVDWRTYLGLDEQGMA